MYALIATTSILSIAAAALATAAAALLARLAIGRRWHAVAAGLMTIAGTLPPTVLATMWYARQADYAWAIRGPGVLGQLGSAPWLLSMLTFSSVFAATCWTAAVLLARRGLATTQWG